MTKDHRELLLAAKQDQLEELKEASAASSQLVKAVAAVIKANSSNGSLSCPPVMDKITTIHDLDKEIDRQLNEDIAGGYAELLQAKERLAHSVKKTRRALAVEPHQSYLDLLQRQAELIDVDLRVLENTVKLIKSGRAPESSST